jgi:hypothetical protein
MQEICKFISPKDKISEQHEKSVVDQRTEKIMNNQEFKISFDGCLELICDFETRKLMENPKVKMTFEECKKLINDTSDNECFEIQKRFFLEKKVKEAVENIKLLAVDIKSLIKEIKSLLFSDKLIKLAS